MQYARLVKIFMQLPDDNISAAHLSILYTRLIRQHDSLLSARLEITICYFYLDDSVRHGNGRGTHGVHVLRLCQVAPS